MPRDIETDRPQSSALLANLEETRREVVIPEEYQALLETVRRYYGVRQALEKLLIEFFHPLRNVKTVVSQLRSLCGGMFHYFERSDERAASAALLNRLFCILFDTELDGDEQSRLVGTNLQFIETMSRSGFAAEYRQVMLEALERLTRVQSSDGRSFLPFSGLSKRLGGRLVGDEVMGARFSGLYAGTVRFGVDVFAETIALGEWCSSQPVGEPSHCRSAVVDPLEEALQRASGTLGRATPEEILELPNLDDLLNIALAGARQLASPIERIGLYVYLAGVPELEHRNMEILRALYYSIDTLCAEGSDEDVSRAVDLITGHLIDCEPSHKNLLYRCLEQLGRGIGRRGGDRLVDHFVERTIATGFEGPEVSGVSEEWETHVNPYHLPCLRTWLAIIMSDPFRFEQLLSALVINIHFKGLFVSDTDLFQRDVSALLNSDIADAFALIMQVVTHVPVFFNEVGSEGELRDVSTRIDQITHRRDPVIHYLRKQCHAESNNRLVGFAANVYRYWETGDLDGLQPYLPDSVLASLQPEADWFAGPHAVARDLKRRGRDLAELQKLELDELETELAGLDHGGRADRDRVMLLIRLYRLLKTKYSNSPEGIFEALEHSPLVKAETVAAFAEACDRGEPLPVVAAGNRVLSELKAQIVSSEVTEAFENIYHKRHIAAGIPSMYGTYREPKFDAMGLTLRVMSFLKPRLEACVADFNYRYMTRESIAEAHKILSEMLTGLKIAGLRVQHLSTKLEILGRIIEHGTLSAGQFLNIFDFMSEALSDVVETNYIALHNRNLERLPVTHEGARGRGVRTAGRRSERFLRSIIASTYSIQELDLFLRRIGESLRRMTATLSEEACSVVLGYNPARLVCFLHGEDEEDDQLALGYKGYSLKQLCAIDMPVPEGFVISTQLFDIQGALGYQDLRKDTRERISAAVERLEQESGLERGDPKRPLVLSVRSGSAFSMPGMMDTILNVGLNVPLLEAMDDGGERAWGAWDCYRRYLQNVAMSCGADRDLFDEVMIRHKEAHGVDFKLDFTAAQMKEMALEYREMGERQGVRYLDEPFDQLMQAVFLVLDSWDSEPARFYRRQVGLADGWGTAVIVQRMVFGNMNRSSGSGVVFTTNPRSSTTVIGLFGDFTRCSQGEDVVAGLVSPSPISERQRTEYSPGVEGSLETEFPEIYKAIRGAAFELINDHGYEHQEIEFTFDSGEADGLHLLQTRPLRHTRTDDVKIFAHPERLDEHLLGSGIGVSGGAMAGRVAFSQVDVDRLRSSQPDDPVILLRPDTVPEDIGVVLSVDGLLTARGGFTSHAAVTAKRLGRCCVVNCKDLVVDTANNVARIGDTPILAGDQISIDGHSGLVWAGAHEIAGARDPVRLI
ncbi:MAG: PEP/pyruvate-binding domain-containing protein [Thermoanaerobaculales bacterium]|jgi:pyruvate,orthophosphate dikinase|nr:PEP/pyruvate-binding domain-containing protein [Thermoanaerobaculales bacterium]